MLADVTTLEQTQEEDEKQAVPRLQLDRRRRLLDTVIMNPPFGTRKAGVDMTFVRVALQARERAIVAAT